MPIVELEFRIRNAREAIQSQEELDKALKETEKSATGSARAVARLEKEYRAGFRTAENYRKELARVSKEARDGSDAQVSALKRLNAEEQRLAQQRKRHAAEQERLERQRKASSFSGQFGVGLGGSRLNLGALSPMASAFGSSPGQFAGAATGALAGMAVAGITRGFESVGGGALSLIISGGRTAIGILTDLGRTAVQTGADIAMGLGETSFNTAMSMDSLKRGMATISKNADDLRRQLGVSRQMARRPGIGLEESIESTLQLQSARAPEALATRSILAFGNALASVGKGKEDLKEVIHQLSQLFSSGKMQGDEFRIIAERVPQARAALVAAFGTADMEKINKSGLGMVEIISRLVTELEKLPTVSGGFRNTLDNLKDDFKIASEPLGQGLAMLGEGILGGTGAGFSKLSELMRSAGEVFAAIGNSGVAAEAIGKALEPLAGTNVNSFEDALATGAAAITAAMRQVPLAFSIASEYAKLIGHNISEGWKLALAIAPLVSELIKGTFTSVLADVSGLLGMLRGGGKSATTSRSNKSKVLQGSLLPGVSIDAEGMASAASRFTENGMWIDLLMLATGDMGAPSRLLNRALKSPTAAAGGRFLTSGGDLFSALSAGLGSSIVNGAMGTLGQKDKDGKTLGSRFLALLESNPNFRSLSLSDPANANLAGMVEQLFGNPEKGIKSSFMTSWEADKQRILAARRGLPDIPDGLTFNPDGSTASGTDKKSELEKLLAKLDGIERKGRMGGADFLRGITTGEMDNPAFNLTGAEMMRAGARGDFLELPHYSTNLEQELTRLILQTLRQMGAGTPALGGF